VSIRVRAALTGLAISTLCPLSALLAYLCSEKDSVYVVSLILFWFAFISSLPGFFVGWLVVHGFHLDSMGVPIVAVFLSNLAFYSIISFAVLDRRRKLLV